MQDSHHQLSGHALRVVMLLAAVYLVVLLAVLFIFGYTPTNDGVGYLEYAQKCLQQGQPYPTAQLYSEIPFVWNVGIINLTELSLWISGSIMPLLVLMCVMKAATALFMSLIASRLIHHNVAILAMMLYIIYPNNWGQSTMLSSEIPADCLLMAAMWLALSSHTIRSMFASGLLMALANWFRPTAPIFLGSLFLYFLFFHRQRLALRMGSMLLGYGLFVGVVGTSCYLRTGHFVYQARSYWFSMVDECYDGAPVAPHWGQPVWPEGTPRYIENHEQMDCFEYEKIWKQRSLDWLRSHKTDYLKKVPGRLYYMYQSDYDNMPVFLSNKAQAENNYITIPFHHLLSEASSMNGAQWLSLFCLLLYGLLLLLAAMGTIRLVRGRQWQQLFLPLFIVVGGSLALVLVMHGETRFKDPLMPFIFILAASNIVYLRKKQ